MLYRVGRQDASVCLSFVIGTFSALLLFSGIANASPYEWYAGEYVVGMQSTGGAADAPVAINGAQVVDQIGNGGVVVRRTSSGAMADAHVGGIATYNAASDTFCATLMQSNHNVRSCSPNYVMRTSAVPNDSNYGSLWGLKGEYGIDAPSAWDLETGSTDVVVAVIDTGVDYAHPDLADNVWTNPGEVPGNGRDDDNNGYVDDVHGINAINSSGNPMDDNSHGTHVSGTIGGVGNNARGVAGINWNTRIMGLKFLDAAGSGSLSNAIKAINYMVMMKNRGVNIRVANNSWGGGGFDRLLSEAIERASNAGIIFLAAAGNSANDNDALPSYPSSYNFPNVVGVAAIDSNGNLASFSNYGATSVDIAAPGVDILSTIPGNRYSSYSGTSMATPHVTGALALLLSHEPALSMAQAIERMYASGRDLSSLSGVVLTGRTLNVNRMLRNETSPFVPAPANPGCLYSMTQSSDGPDLSADAGAVVLSGLDDGYATVALPFSFPLHGESVSSLAISANGVVYTQGAPSSIDYLPGATAPKNSIAPLHTDLFPSGGNNAVRVNVGPDSITINWTATTYLLREGTVTIRMRINSFGEISEWLSFSNSEILKEVRSKAVIGLRADSALSARTYAVNDSKITNGLALKFTPYCDVSQGISRVVESNLTGEDKRGNAINSVLPGGFMNLAALGAGTGNVKVAFKIDGRKCRDTRNAAFVNGVSLVRGKFPKVQAKKLEALATGEDGVTSKAILKVKAKKTKTKSRKSAVKKLTARQTSNACQNLVSSLAEQ